MRCRKKHHGFCIAAIILISAGVVWLCLLSYRFFLMAAAALLIIIGIVLIRKC